MNCQDRKLFEELEQENAGLRARWEKLKEKIHYSLALYEDNPEIDMSVARQIYDTMKELEQDD